MENNECSVGFYTKKSSIILLVLAAMLLLYKIFTANNPFDFLTSTEFMLAVLFILLNSSVKKGKRGSIICALILLTFLFVFVSSTIATYQLKKFGEIISGNSLLLPLIFYILFLQVFIRAYREKAGIIKSNKTQE